MTSSSPEMVKNGFSGPSLVGPSILPVFFSNLHIVVVSLRKTVSYPQLNEGTEGSDQNRDSNDKK